MRDYSPRSLTPLQLSHAPAQSPAEHAADQVSETMRSLAECRQLLATARREVTLRSPTVYKGGDTMPLGVPHSTRPTPSASSRARSTGYLTTSPSIADAEEWSRTLRRHRVERSYTSLNATKPRGRPLSPPVDVDVTEAKQDAGLIHRRALERALPPELVAPEPAKRSETKLRYPVVLRPPTMESLGGGATLQLREAAAARRSPVVHVSRHGSIDIRAAAPRAAAAAAAAAAVPTVVDWVAPLEPAAPSSAAAASKDASAEVVNRVEHDRVLSALTQAHAAELDQRSAQERSRLSAALASEAAALNAASTEERQAAALRLQHADELKTAKVLLARQAAQLRDSFEAEQTRARAAHAVEIEALRIAIAEERDAQLATRRVGESSEAQRLRDAHAAMRDAHARELEAMAASRAEAAGEIEATHAARAERALESMQREHEAALRERKREARKDLAAVRAAHGATLEERARAHAVALRGAESEHADIATSNVAAIRADYEAALTQQQSDMSEVRRANRSGE